MNFKDNLDHIKPPSFSDKQPDETGARWATLAPPTPFRFDQGFLGIQAGSPAFGMHANQNKPVGFKYADDWNPEN